MRLLLVVVAGVVVGCGSVANPRSCRDGSCTDARFPYCDLEGLIQETPETCVAVECTAGEFKGCRDGRAITCNTTGNNYDLVDCPNGCDANGCIQPEVIECSTSDDCDNPTPVCSAAMTCRACAVDDECESGICDVDSGGCVANSEVVYSAPAGTDIATCTLIDPCSLPRAVMLASSNPLRPWVKLATGNYDKSIQTSSGTVRVVGPRSAIVLGDSPSTTTGTVSIGVGGKAILRGFTLDLTKQAALCGGVGASGPFHSGGELHLVDMFVTSPASNSVIFAYGCSGSIVQSHVKFTSSAGLRVTSATGEPTTHLRIDRLFFEGAGDFTTLNDGTNCEIKVTNSVFDNVPLLLGSASSIAFSTVVRKQLFMNGGRVENVIILAPGVTNAYDCSGCTSRSNIAFPQMTTIAGTTVVDPQFVNLATGDYHLKSTSPAVNAARPQPDLTTDHDFDGVMRPQGASLDIGAFELVP